MSPENRNQLKNEPFPPTISNFQRCHCSLIFHRTSRPLVCLRRESIPFSKLIWQWKKNNFETHRCSEDGRKALKWQTRSYGGLCSLGSWCLAKSPDSWAPFSDYILLPQKNCVGLQLPIHLQRRSSLHWDCPGPPKEWGWWVNDTHLRFRNRAVPTGRLRPFSDTVVSATPSVPLPFSASWLPGGLARAWWSSHPVFRDCCKLQIVAVQSLSRNGLRIPFFCPPTFQARQL